MQANFLIFISTHPWILIVAAIWTIPWKGVALWKAARNQSTIWFIILLIVNTVGLLEIIYIFLFSQKKLEPQIDPPNDASNPEKRVLDVKSEKP